MADTIQTPIRYFSTIVLKHQKSGKFLASIEQNFPWEGSSKEQQLVGAIATEGTGCVWLIKPRHLKNFTKSSSDTVGFNDSIRLEHVATRKNLHSHPNVQSHASQQQEVTAFGDNGIGDNNDNWLVELTSETDFKVGTSIRLVHQWTKKNLHSHDDRDLGPEYKDWQEVTCFEGKDENDLWIVHSIQPPLKELKGEPLFTLEKNGLTKTFYSPNDFKNWIANERKEFDWLQQVHQRFNRSGETFNNFNTGFGSMETQCNNVINQLGANDFESHLNSLKNTCLTHYKGRLIFSDDKYAVFAKNIAKTMPLPATYALAVLCDIPFNVNEGPETLRGSWIGYTFKEGLLGRSEQETKALEEVYKQANGQLGVLNASVQNAENNFTIALKQGSDLVDAHKRDFRKVLDDTKADLKQLTETYDKEMSLKASVIYWQNKSKTNWQAARWIASVAILFGGSFLWFLLNEIKAVLPSQTVDKPPQYWQVASIFILTTFGIWFLRILVKLFFSNVHLATDATERSVMMTSYFAMMREGAALEPKDREIIIQTLFRPSQTGIVTDHGPGHIFELWAGKGDK